MKKRIATGLFVLLTVVPLILGLGYSLLYSLGLVGLLNHGFTLEHWQKLVQDQSIFTTFGYNLYITATSLVFILALALFFSRWLMLYHHKGFYGSLFLPLTFPPLIAAFSWYYLLSPAGILSRICYWLGLTEGVNDFPRLVNDFLSAGIIITHIFLVFPLFTILFFHQSKKERVAELEAMACTLGSTKGRFFREIYIPLLLKKTAPFILLYGIFLFGAYEVPLLSGRSSPRMVTVFITEKMTRFNLLDIPQGHAMAVLYSLVVIVITLVFTRKSKRMIW
ncbi:MAG: hypothetical protein R3D00_14995 [Bacteroidia bacterium]